MSPFNATSRFTRVLSALAAAVLMSTVFAAVAIGLTSSDVASFASLASATA